MQYFNQIKNRRRLSQIITPPDPVLTPEDEAFLERVTSEPDSAQLPPATATDSSKAAKIPAEDPQPLVLNEGAQDIPLPASPVDDFGKKLGEERKAHENHTEPKTKSGAAQSQSSGTPNRKKRWSAMFWRRNSNLKKGKEAHTSDQAQSNTSAPPSRVSTPAANEKDAQQDADDVTDILERLNLAADHNRVFSISDETQELLRKFTLIFKDLINGVPTAYRDLEMLLTNGNRQLQDNYAKLPSFLQKMIEKLPERWAESLAPEMLAAASQRASASGIDVENVGKTAAAAEKMGINVPSLKDLVAKPTAIVGMLRSIMAFLRARFPAVLGMNVLWSLALFILLFVLWYCHKRGREVRLENERLVTEQEINKLNEDASAGKIRPTETLTTTARQGASTDEIREGVKEVEQARASAATDSGDSGASETLQRANEENAKPAPPPARSKSRRLSIWSWSKPEPTPKIAPYPGT